MMSRMPLALLLGTLALAPLLGGRMALGEEAIPLEDWWAEAFLSTNRFFASPGHAVLGILAALAILQTSLRRNVLTVPAPPMLFVLILFYGSLTLSALLSHHPQAAWAEWARWSVYLSVFLATIYILGRELYIRYAVGAILFGASWVSAQGVMEHWANSATSPGWRVMDGWQNPNALAGYLALTLPVSFALVITSWKEQCNKTASVKLRSAFPFSLMLIGLGLCSATLWVTGSKGGLAAAIVGILSFCLILFPKRPKVIGRIAFVFAIVLILAGVFIRAGIFTGHSGPSRVLTPTAEAEQSIQFRLQLWKDSWELIKKSGYMGVGLGAFGASFTQVSKTEGSLLAHNAYLQWGAETGLLGLIAMLTLALFWFFHVLTPHPAAPWETHVMKAGIVSSILSGGANGFIESNLSFFGFSLTVFALLGMGLLMSPDSVRSERIPIPMRIFPWTLIAFIAAWVLVNRAASDIYLSAARHAYAQQDPNLALKLSEKARSFPVTSPRLLSFYARALFGSGKHSEALQVALTATEQYPSPFTFADLGQIYALLGNDTLAEQALKQAIDLAPHHPRWKRTLFDFYKQNKKTKQAEKMAQELVAMEDSLFYKLRALPQFINTDTVDAHLYLADLAKNKADVKSETLHLEKAFAILKKYAEKTYLELLRLTGGKEELREFSLAGETLAQATENVRKGISVGEQLARIYKRQGLSDKVQLTHQNINMLKEMLQTPLAP